MAALPRAQQRGATVSQSHTGGCCNSVVFIIAMAVPALIVRTNIDKKPCFRGIQGDSIISGVLSLSAASALDKDRARFLCDAEPCHIRRCLCDEGEF